MRKLFFALVILLTLLSYAVVLAHADDVKSASLSGVYYVQNVREVGSILHLNPDGSFQWSMSYGAVDQYAHGTWHSKDNNVLLETVAPSGSPKFRLFSEDELRIRKTLESGKWAAIVGMPRVGPAVDMEVVFESNSGKQAIAVTNRNGEAIVTMANSEKWTRSGLRRKGDSGDWQWFAIPSKRAAAGITGFAIDDEKWIVPQAFERMLLKRQDDLLVSEDGKLVYSRH